MGVGVVGEGELRRSHKPTRERFAGRGHPSPAPRNVPEFANTKRIELQGTHLTCGPDLTLHSLWLPAIVAPKAKIEKMTFQKCYKVLQNGKMTSQKYCKVCKNAKSIVTTMGSQRFGVSKTQYVCHFFFDIALTMGSQRFFFRLDQQINGGWARRAM